MDLMNTCKFNNLSKIGAGTFGSVFSCRRVVDGTVYALKRVNLEARQGLDPYFVTREAVVLNEVKHPHVIQLCCVLPESRSLGYIFEYLALDLDRVIASQKIPFLEKYTQRLLSMLLRGLAHCHSRNIIHRDLKPSNILLSMEGVLKIADFGLSRCHDDKACSRSYTTQVSTRWYRSPELLFGSKEYDYAVDVWAVGIIAGVILRKTVLFAGENDINQIYKILQLFGKIGGSAWPNAKTTPDYGKVLFPDLNKIYLPAIFDGMSQASTALLCSLLLLNPSKRITAIDALKMEFFYNYTGKKWECNNQGMVQTGIFEHNNFRLPEYFVETHVGK